MIEYIAILRKDIIFIKMSNSGYDTVNSSPRKKFFFNILLTILIKKIDKI